LCLKEFWEAVQHAADTNAVPPELTQKDTLLPPSNTSREPIEKPSSRATRSRRKDIEAKPAIQKSHVQPKSKTDPVIEIEDSDGEADNKEPHVVEGSHTSRTEPKKRKAELPVSPATPPESPSSQISVMHTTNGFLTPKAAALALSKDKLPFFDLGIGSITSIFDRQADEGVKKTVLELPISSLPRFHLVEV